MSEILEKLTELLAKTVVLPDSEDIKQLLEYLIPDDFLVLLNSQSNPDDAPDEETLTLEELRRNMEQNKELDKR